VTASSVSWISSHTYALITQILKRVERYSAYAIVMFTFVFLKSILSNPDSSNSGLRHLNHEGSFETASCQADTDPRALAIRLMTRSRGLNATYLLNVSRTHTKSADTLLSTSLPQNTVNSPSIPKLHSIIYSAPYAIPCAILVVSLGHKSRTSLPSISPVPRPH
jgi:hypothetical protein